MLQKHVNRKSEEMKFNYFLAFLFIRWICCTFAPFFARVHDTCMRI